MPEPLDLDELARLADAATPGPWRSFEQITDGGDWHGDRHRALVELHTERGTVVAHAWGTGNRQDNTANAAYIAALNPATVLALLARLRAAEGTLVEIAAGWGGMSPDASILAGKADAALVAAGGDRR